MPPTLVTVADAAERLGLHEQTIRDYIKRKKLRAVRIGNAIRIDLTSIMAELAVTEQDVRNAMPE